MATRDLEHKIRSSRKEKLQYALFRTIQDNPSLIHKIDQYGTEYQDTVIRKYQQNKPNEIKYMSRKERYNLIISRFIRDASQGLLIPSEIKEICLSFYYIPLVQLPESTIDERGFYQKWWIPASRIGETGYQPVRSICLKSDRDTLFSLNGCKVL